ncbi:MAG: NAD(+) synthase [Actinobacteria bacterium]|nr:NAD(+) synthase [Actinomycetota bacterium]
MEQLAEHLTDWIRAEVTAGGGCGAVFGLSGGIDSAVVAALAKQAFPHHTLGVVMPCHSDPRDAEDGALVAHHFGVPSATVDLAPVYDLLLEQLAGSSTDLPESRLATANLKPRLRMTTLYAFANQLGYRVLGTGNRSELAVGYFTKYGDGGVDLLPLGSLVKSEVRDLARSLGVPARIITKPPSAGLWADQTDEAEMGLTYEELDAYLLTGAASPAVKAKVDAMNAASEHKRALPRIAPKPGA